MKTFTSLMTDKTPLGTWLMAGAPNTAEALGHAGFDFLVVDMEHVTIEFSDLAHILRAIGCTPSVPVVRLAWSDQVLVKRAMDAGAETLMLPFIQTAEEAERAVSYMRYPPHGVRGVAAVHRGSRFGTLPGYLANAMSAPAPSCNSKRPRPSPISMLSQPSMASMRCLSVRATFRRPWATSAISATTTYRI